MPMEKRKVTSLLGPVGHQNGFPTKNGIRVFYTETVTRKPIVYTNAGNALEDRLRLVVPEDAIAENILKPKIYLTESERQEAKKRLVSDGIDGNKPLIMIGILGSAQNKSLPHKTMAQLIDATIAQTHGQLIFNFIPSQKEEVLQIYKLIDHSKKSHVFWVPMEKDFANFWAYFLTVPC